MSGLDKIRRMITKSKPVISRGFRLPVFRFKRLSLADTGVDAGRLASAVAKTELFCNVDSGLVQAMLAAMTVRRVRQGEPILRQGRRSDSFVLLAAGQAQVARAREGERTERQLAVLTKPEGLGEEALLGAEIRSVSATMLTDGFILKIRRAEFARLVSAQGVQWLTTEAADGMAQPPGEWLWVGSARTRPSGMGAAVPTVTLERLRQRLPELDPARHYLCCGRDDANSALAAFLLTQRGFKASAVQGGRRVTAGARPVRGKG